jgi:predicted nucleic acid-binding Zn ribbon protein
MVERVVITPEPQHRLAVHRRAKVECPACGRTVERKARHQRFCSDRCKEKGRQRTRKAFLGQDTGAPTHPYKLTNKNKGMQSQKCGPNPRISGVLDALAQKAAATLKWPGWTEADYRRAYEKLVRDPAFNPSKRSGRKAVR